MDLLRSIFPDVRLVEMTTGCPFDQAWQIQASERLYPGGPGRFRLDGRSHALGRGPTPESAIEDALISWAS